ncbi:MAG: SCP2 sterol-binding domain-containing protein [Solirubrobacteraceae bacterium]
MSALPQRTVATIRRTLAGAPVQVVEGFAHAVRTAPEERLDQVMRSPARRVLLETIFWQMPRHIDPHTARSMNCTIRWRITGKANGDADVYDLEFIDGRCRVIRGPGVAPPKLTITVEGAEFLRLATGNSDPVKAYFTGRVALAGDVMVAAKASGLFRIPGVVRHAASPQPETGG